MATTLDTFIPFDAGAGATVTEGQWRSMAARWLTDGVLPGIANEFAVSQRAAGADMSVDVATGETRIQGHQGVSTAVKNLTVTANGSGNPRVDLVVLRADFANNRIELDVLAGTAAAAPVEPALTQSASVWEIPIAAIAVANAAASIVTADLRDRRTFTRTPTQMFVKEPVRFATTTALAASTVVGTKRTANANGAFPATDGVTAVAGDRLLDKDHGTAAQRGIWRVVELGSASRPWVLERPADFDESRDVTDGSWVVVKEGTLYAGTGWLQTASDPITLGTTSLAFTQFPIVQSQANGGAYVETQESTASTSYTDLATGGPAVTLTTGTKALVMIQAGMDNTTGAGNYSRMGFAVSGATTVAASDPFSTYSEGPSQNMHSGAFLVTGLTPGSNTFTMKYKVEVGGTAFFSFRRITVVDMGS